MSETRRNTGENAREAEVGTHHKISVAPMMDWTDEVDLSWQINRLAVPRNRRS